MMVPLFLLHLATRCSSIPMMSRCLAEDNPCEEMTVGNCELGGDNVIATYESAPGKCAKQCQLSDNCEFWRAKWDGTECLLIKTDFHQVGVTMSTNPQQSMLRTANPLPVLLPAASPTAME